MKLTVDQIKAQELFTTDALFILLYGGSRSGKTYLAVRNIVTRAGAASNSRHCILRFRFNQVKTAIVLDTFPKVMRECFPNVKYKIDKQDWYARFENGSEIWFGGLDDKDRTEKILGKEYVTIYIDECPHVSWHSVGIVSTRLAQKVDRLDGTPMQTRIYMSCNPPKKNHWVYLVFIKKIDPETKVPFNKPSNYLCYGPMNPDGNAENITDGYLDTLAQLSGHLRKRFLLGEFGDATPNALFLDETIEKWRITDGNVPQFIRVVVGVDPSGADDIDNADNDEIGILVCGLGTDGNIYVIADYTIKAGPGIWGKVVTDAYDNHKADCVVAETNYGGAMVRQTIQTARARTPFQAVTASRGKHVRAEPVSALYEQGRVRHVGFLRDLEDELAGFTTSGYVGAKSPNRADALVWAVNALFPSLNAPTQPVTIPLKGSQNFFAKRLNNG